MKIKEFRQKFIKYVYDNTPYWEFWSKGKSDTLMFERKQGTGVRPRTDWWTMWMNKRGKKVIVTFYVSQQDKAVPTTWDWQHNHPGWCEPNWVAEHAFDATEEEFKRIVDLVEELPKKTSFGNPTK
jgi:hypothetical protein